MHAMKLNSQIYLHMAIIIKACKSQINHWCIWCSIKRAARRVENVSYLQSHWQFLKLVFVIDSCLYVLLTAINNICLCGDVWQFMRGSNIELNTILAAMRCKSGELNRSHKFLPLMASWKWRQSLCNAKLFSLKNRKSRYKYLYI